MTTATQPPARASPSSLGLMQLSVMRAIRNLAGSNRAYGRNIRRLLVADGLDVDQAQIYVCLKRLTELRLVDVGDSVSSPDDPSRSVRLYSLNSDGEAMLKMAIHLIGGSNEGSHMEGKGDGVHNARH